MKQLSRSAPRGNALCNCRAFPPRLEQLDDRNAPGSVWSLLDSSLMGTLALWPDLDASASDLAWMGAPPAGVQRDEALGLLERISALYDGVAKPPDAAPGPGLDGAEH